MDAFDRALAEAQRWLDRPDVDAVGEGEEGGRRVIDVWVRDEVDEAAFPAELEGVPVRLQRSGGPIRAL